MPAKSKSADPASTVSEDAIRHRAYFMWEADGRPDGKHEHYWHEAHAEAARGRTPAEPRANGSGAKPVKAKAAADKPTKKAATRPRAAVAASKAK
ncbi:DUF2934 domain-containing protein [Devosia sp. ZB163]|uniref:DUF2934 domain-containing protein n=1 Tax=Devosia sp. ZB163 TaxID=3025938 RepID=UPI00236145BA|nr:DUF2934 domain-containing protein [Devosia sp. ZB163]MDC9822308.1 DUF2934 domain-containing protein [Devosia sp. ZB163]